MEYFSNIGRRVPTEGVRVFNQIPSEYYKLSQPALNFEQILKNLEHQGMVIPSFKARKFKQAALGVLSTIESNDSYRNLLKGVHVPFAISNTQKGVDLGVHLESKLLPSVQNSFNGLFPQSHFKAVLQSNSELSKNIKLAKNSRYESFIEATQNGTVVGWYFPQALQEFDVSSQRSQMTSLPIVQDMRVCLSGAIDICTSLVGVPSLLMNEDYYPPILCMSAYEHSDPRMILLMKAYGPHLEFWCMTQMLTSTTTQVSEQWAGGLTVYITVE